MELMQVEPPLVGKITQVQMLYPGSVVPLAMFLIMQHRLPAEANLSTIRDSSRENVIKDFDDARSV